MVRIRDMGMYVEACTLRQERGNAESGWSRAACSSTFKTRADTLPLPIRNGSITIDQLLSVGAVKSLQQVEEKITKASHGVSLER